MPPLTLPDFRHPFIKAALVFVALLVMFWVLVLVLVDKQLVAKQFIEGVEHITGYETYAGAVKLSILPVPTVTIERLSVDNSPYASTESLMICERVDISVDLVGLMMGEVKPGTVLIVRPAVELETYRDGSTNWDFINRLNLSEVSFPTPSSIKVTGGTIQTTNILSGQMHELNGVELDMGFDAASRDIDIDIGFAVLEKIVEIRGVFEAKAFSSLSQYNFGLDLTVSEGDNEIIYKGDFGHGLDGLHYDGVFSFNVDDMLPWLKFLFAKEARDGIFQNMPDAVPLKISGKAKAEGTKYAWTQIEIKSGETVGRGQIISDDNVYPQMQSAFNFSLLDFGKVLDPKRPISDEAFNSFFTRLLPKDVSSSFDLRIEKLIAGGVEASNLRFLSTLDGGEMVINQASMQMPGDTELILFGIFKRSLDGSLHFDGSVELLGQHMLEFASAFGFEDDKFITDHDGEFRAKSNVFISRANSVISDFKLQAGTLLASGGMTAGQGQEFDGEYTLRISGVKLDPFAALLIPVSKRDAMKSDFEDIMRRLDWLDTIKSRLKLNLVLQDYTLSKTQGTQSVMHLIVEQGKISVQDTEFELGGIVFSGAMGYDQREEFPKITADMNVSSFNLEPFAAKSLRKHPVARDNFTPIWSEDFFSFNQLKGYHSEIDIRVRQLQHPDMPMQNVRLVASSANGKWDIKSFRADIWDGVLKANGSLDITSIPALSISFSFEEIDSVRLFEAFAGHSNFLGSLSLNGQLATSGLNALNWVKNSRGTFVVLGQNLVVKGFDVSSLVQAIPSVRSVADVTNTVRVSMLRRHTSFSLVEGSFYLDNGVFRTTELKLRAKHSIGLVSGYMDASTWMMDCAVDFGLVTLTRGDYPSISIRFTNSMDDPEMTPDTRSLEAFIARKYLRQ